MKRSMKLSLLGLGAMALMACSSGVKKADIPMEANPSEEISELERGISESYGEHLDLLAHKDLQKAERHLNKAKSKQAKGKEQRKILEDVAYGKAYLQRAKETSDSRRAQLSGVLEAREQALASNVRAYPPARKELKEIDDQIRSEADDLNDLAVDEVAHLQSRYLDLQLEALKNNQLGQARSQVEAAKKNKAAKYAPRTLRQAEIDLRQAESVVSVNRSNPEAYAEAVAKSVASAEMLTAVLKATDRGRINEDAATRIVMQERQIDTLEGRVGALGSTTEQMQERERMLQGELEERERALASEEARVRFQASLEEARRLFKEDEAEVYQQGDRLVIRLKSMNFPSGSANLPSESLAVLSKVRSVAEQLGPQEVAVEGHTDSTGSPEINAKISEERAKTVASYLASNGVDEEKIQTRGYGFERPIASNRSPQGRAQNRRVDILITPMGPEAMVERGTASMSEEGEKKDIKEMKAKKKERKEMEKERR